MISKFGETDGWRKLTGAGILTAKLTLKQFLTFLCFVLVFLPNVLRHSCSICFQNGPSVGFLHSLWMSAFVCHTACLMLIPPCRCGWVYERHGVRQPRVLWKHGWLLPLSVLPRVPAHTGWTGLYRWVHRCYESLLQSSGEAKQHFNKRHFTLCFLSFFIEVMPLPSKRMELFFTHWILCHMETLFCIHLMKKPVIMTNRSQQQISWATYFF